MSDKLLGNAHKLFLLLIVKITLLYKLLKWLVLGSFIFLFLLLLIFRWVPLPTSSYIFHQDYQAWQHPRIYKPARYQWIDWQEMPKEVALAAIAAEDQRFPNHWGFDLTEIYQALEKRKQGKTLRGASTISQQMTKNLFLWNGRSMVRKGMEMLLTFMVELTWSKQRILEVYLNIVQFGDVIYGIQAGSHAHFNKTPAELTTEEAALLIAVLPTPSISNVQDPSPNLRKRQQWILKQMKQLGGVRYLNKL